MHKKLLLVFIISFFTSVSLFSMTRLHDVTQSGMGNDGTIKIDFSGNYDVSNVKLSLHEDKVELLFKEAFVIPVRRVYKPSSAKASVTRMEVSQIPGNLVRLWIYFRIPMDIIKQTAKLDSTKSSILFNYSIIANIKTEESVALTSNIITNENVDVINKEETTKQNPKTQEIDFFTKTNETKSKAEKSLFYTFFRMITALAVVIGLFFVIAFLVKKYLKNSPVSKYMNKDVQFKMINQFTIMPGKTLLVMEVYGQRMLLSSTKDNLTFLTHLDIPTQSKSIQQNINNNIDISPETENIEDDFKISSSVNSSDTMTTRLKERLKNLKNL